MNSTENIETAKIPRSPRFETISRLSKFTKNDKGNLTNFEGILISWNTVYSGYDMQTNIIKENPKFNLLSYCHKSVIVTPITEEQLEKMLEYVRTVKSQVGKKIDWKTTFEKEVQN